jgi:uncharacterized protein (UPF0262 family)
LRLLSGFLQDTRDEVEMLTDSYSGNEFIYPQGKVFYLCHYAAPYSWRWRLRGKKGKIIIFKIDTRNVIRVVGNVSSFRIVFRDYYIECGEYFEIKY